MFSLTVKKLQMKFLCHVIFFCVTCPALLSDLHLCHSSHARNQGGPGECQRVPCCPPRGNWETQLWPEPGPQQHQQNPQWPRLLWWRVRRHHSPALPQHPPVTATTADWRKFHTGKNWLQHSTPDNEQQAAQRGAFSLFPRERDLHFYSYSLWQPFYWLLKKSF